ncbi:MAG: N-acetylmuramoyl-L-alanine amidase [Clostridia bacterium]|nr:N-acetylmuramoyl-L-alanine amidase [Clostridia bacterium]
MLKKRLALLLSLFIICACIYIADAGISPAVEVSSQISPAKTVIIDAGHGGEDGGAVAFDGTLEKDINLKIALQAAKVLKLYGFEVIMTRESDTSTSTGESFIKREDLENRLNLMKKNPDSIFVSIHLNKFTTSAAKGSQVFYSKFENSKLLGDLIQNSIILNLQKENKRVNKQATSSTYLLHKATIPAVLVECGFLSNEAELTRLKDSAYQKKLAFCIIDGILQYFKES